MTSLRFPIELDEFGQFVIGDAIAQTEQHALHALRSQDIGVLKVGDLGRGAEGPQTMVRVHQNPRRIDDVLPTAQLAQRVHKVGGKVDGVRAVRVRNTSMSGPMILISTGAAVGGPH